MGSPGLREKSPVSDLEFETGWDRYRLPALLAAGLAIYGASRFDVTRPVAGLLLTYGFPVIAVVAAVARHLEQRGRPARALPCS